MQWNTPVKVESGAVPANSQKAIVTYVLDGDTMDLKGKDGNNFRCRIDTIDTPEIAHPKFGKTGQPYGEESKKTMEQLVLNKEVNVTITSSRTTYGRNLCQIQVEGKGVDLSMLQAGAAWLYRKYSNDPKLAEAEATAKANHKGLFKDPNATPPWQFR